MCSMYSIVEGWSKSNMYHYTIRPIYSEDMDKFDRLEDIKRRNEKIAEEFLMHHIQHTLNICETDKPNE